MRSSLIRSASSLSARIDSESAEIDAAPDGMRAPKVSTRYSRIARLKSCTNMRASRRKANRCMHGYNLARLYIMCTCAEDDTGDTRRHRQPQAATQTWPRMPWRAARAFDGIDACMQGPVATCPPRRLSPLAAMTSKIPLLRLSKETSNVPPPMS